MKKERDNALLRCVLRMKQNKPLPDVRVENRIISARKTEKHYLRRTNANGEIGFNIPLIGDMGDSRTIEVTFADGPYQYDRTFHVPLLGNRKQEFALSFFPEGGDLLDGCNQRVSLKRNSQMETVVICRVIYSTIPEIPFPLSRLNTTVWEYSLSLLLPEKSIRLQPPGMALFIAGFRCRR